jgi:coenzyme F420-reducing hydrogenase delta subunit
MSEPSKTRFPDLDIVVLYCQGCLAGRPNRQEELHTEDRVRTRLVAVPCTSKLELPHLLGVLERGADGVQVVGCGQNACRFLVGSNVAAARVARGRELLTEIGVGAERLGMSRGARLDVTALRARGRERADAVRDYGANPMKPSSKEQPT